MAWYSILWKTHAFSLGPTVTFRWSRASSGQIQYSGRATCGRGQICLEMVKLSLRIEAASKDIGQHVSRGGHPPRCMYTKCGNLCGQRGRKRFIASWGLRMSHICPCTPCPSPQGYRSKVESRHFAHHCMSEGPDKSV
jgi:hypothetical protein